MKNHSRLQGHWPHKPINFAVASTVNWERRISSRFSFELKILQWVLKSSTVCWLAWHDWLRHRMLLFYTLEIWWLSLYWIRYKHRDWKILCVSQFINLFYRLPVHLVASNAATHICQRTVQPNLMKLDVLCLFENSSICTLHLRMRNVSLLMSSLQSAKLCTIHKENSFSCRRRDIKDAIPMSTCPKHFLCGCSKYTYTLRLCPEQKLI